MGEESLLTRWIKEVTHSQSLQSECGPQRLSCSSNATQGQLAIRQYFANREEHWEANRRTNRRAGITRGAREHGTTGRASANA